MGYFIASEAASWQRSPSIGRRAAGVVEAGGRYPSGTLHAVRPGTDVTVCGKSGLTLFEDWSFEATRGEKCPDCLAKVG